MQETESGSHVQGEHAALGAADRRSQAAPQTALLHTILGSSNLELHILTHALQGERVERGGGVGVQGVRGESAAHRLY